VLIDTTAPLAALLQVSGGWRVIQGDDKFILFERTGKV
jgi:hypothetical protein